LRIIWLRFFCFQAEVGIRDFHVTGVQTCALPILVFVDLVGFTELSERLEAELLAGILDEYLGAFIPAAEDRGGEVSKLLGDGMRSEERRVGVECAYRRELCRPRIKASSCSRNRAR